MQHLRPATLRLLFSGMLLALLAACATSPGGGTGPASENRAERLVRQGNHAEAARMYEELANGNPPPARDQFALAATRAWLDANRADDAQRALALASAELPAAQHLERELLRAEVGAARGQYQAALQQLSRLAEPARPQDASRLFYLRQQIALRAGQPGEAVRAGIARERVATDDAGRTRARRDLLSDLRGAIDRGLRIDPAASRDALERGWIEIAQIASQAGTNPLGATGLIERWRQRFPGHPANTILGSDILDPAGRTEVAGVRGSAVSGPVALLLPLTDRTYGRPATLVRDGYQAALNRMPDASRYELRVYDTSAQSVPAALQRALSEGASFIVGPLTKEEVQAAASQRPGNVPMLLLNTLSGGGSMGSWQYALAPEDEARQIARQITGSGGRNVVVFAPTDDWGRRVVAAFTDELKQAGGTVIAEGLYANDREQIDATVRKALGIDASRERHRAVQALVGRPLAFEVQPTSGIDAIFTAGYQRMSQVVRQINTLLRFYNAGSVPAYVTGDAVSEERVANRDLDGMRLLDMSWLLDTVGAAYDARQASAGMWRTRAEAALFAFGYDAANLAAVLRRNATSWPFDGMTGRLTVATDGRIERSLNWARMQDGEVRPADPLAP